MVPIQVLNLFNAVIIQGKCLLKVSTYSKAVVSEPDPRKIGKEGLVNGVGWKCALRNVRNFKPYKAYRISAEPDTCTSVLSFPLGVLKQSQTRKGFSCG